MTANEPPNDSSAHGIDTAVGDSRERPTFSRMLIVLAATVVVLVGMRLAAPVLNPIIFAVVLSLLVGPGAFLALLKTLFVAVMFDTFPETRWLARFMGMGSPDTGAGPSR